MNVGILLCDQVDPLHIEEHGSYSAMYAKFLHSADPKIQFTIFDVKQGDFPTDISVVDAYLITGSHHGVNDGYGWIKELEQFVRTLNQAQKKLIGICFGHQLIAKALGGKVIKSPKGWRKGISQNQVLIPKSWMGKAPKQFNLVVSHQDQVVEPPLNAEIIVSNAFCPIYMMQIGSHFLTVQGHPEFSKAYSKALILSLQESLSHEEFEHGMNSLHLSEDGRLVAQWFINFLSL